MWQVSWKQQTNLALIMLITLQSISQYKAGQLNMQKFKYN